MSVPDYCEPLIGYRVWNVSPAGLLLGRHASEPWPPYAPMVGRCAGQGSMSFLSVGELADLHLQDGVYVSAPAFRCRCGVHAYKTAARRDEIELAGETDLSTKAWGTAHLWGRIIEHAQGWRAEYGYPAEVWTSESDVAARINKRYGVPCVVEPQAEPARAEFTFKGIPVSGGYAFTMPVAYSFWRGAQPVGVVSSLPEGFITPDEAPSQLWTPPPIVASPLSARASKLSDAQCEQLFYRLVTPKGRHG